MLISEQLFKCALAFHTSNRAVILNISTAMTTQL